MASGWMRRSQVRPPGTNPPEPDPVSQWAFDASDQYDMPAEVDATVRTLRRVSIGHFAVFIGTVLLVPSLTLALDWWSEGRLIGGMSPNFAMAAFGLYVFFFVIAFAAARLSNAVEDRMLGDSAGRDVPHEDGDVP